MASAASDLDPAAAEPQVVVDEAVVVEVVVDTEPAKGEAAEEEEEGECGFCLYMKGGGCKEAFEAWEECVAAAEKDGSDMVERCLQTTANLKTCMEAHSEYYAPVFQAEQAVNEAVAAANAEKNKGQESAPSPATEETKKEESVPEPAAAAADEKEVVVEKASSSPASE